MKRGMEGEYNQIWQVMASSYHKVLSLSNFLVIPFYNKIDQKRDITGLNLINQSLVLPRNGQLEETLRRVSFLLKNVSSSHTHSYILKRGEPVCLTLSFNQCVN